MLDPNIKVEKKEAGNFEPLPENIYQVELLDITSEQRATYDTRNKPEKEKIMETVMSFQFTLLNGKDKGESLRGRNVWANFIPTFLYISTKKGKNKLYQIVEALLGRELTLEEEAGGIDGSFLNALIGKQCRVGTKHKKTGEKVFDNIETFYKADDELTPLTEEEREKAKVKSKNTEDNPQKEDVDNFDQDGDNGINLDDIPF